MWRIHFIGPTVLVGQDIGKISGMKYGFSGLRGEKKEKIQLELYSRQSKCLYKTPMQIKTRYKRHYQVAKSQEKCNRMDNLIGGRARPFVRAIISCGGQRN